MLRLNYSNSDIDEISKKLDDEFENIIENVFEIIEEYEKQIEYSKKIK